MMNDDTLTYFFIEKMERVLYDFAEACEMGDLVSFRKFGIVFGDSAAEMLRKVDGRDLNTINHIIDLCFWKSSGGRLIDEIQRPPWNVPPKELYRGRSCAFEGSNWPLLEILMKSEEYPVQPDEFDFWMYIYSNEIEVCKKVDKCMLAYIRGPVMERNYRKRVERLEVSMFEYRKTLLERDDGPVWKIDLDISELTSDLMEELEEDMVIPRQIAESRRNMALLLVTGCEKSPIAMLPPHIIAEILKFVELCTVKALLSPRTYAKILRFFEL